MFQSLLTGSHLSAARTSGSPVLLFLLVAPSFCLLCGHRAIFRERVAMSKQLPSNANLKHLKGQAKQLLDAHKTGDKDACTRFKKHIPRLAQASPTQVRGAKLTLRDAYLVLAREYGYTSWPKLKHHLEAHAIIQTPDGAHQELLRRISDLISERPKEVAKILSGTLNGEPKSAAIIAIALGKDMTTAILKHLSDTEIEEIAQQISNLNAVTTEEEDQHLKTFEQLIVADKYISQGGIDYARGALEKSMGKIKTQTIFNQIRKTTMRIVTGQNQLNARYESTRNRLLKHIAEHPQDIAHILTIHSPQQTITFAVAIGKSSMKNVIKHLPKPIAQILTSPKPTNTFHTEKTETLEHIERLAVTYKYVLTGGRQFALGALAKSFGNKKALKMLDQITPISGFLQLLKLSPKQASTLLSNEPPKTTANILSHLESSQSILIFHQFSAKLKSQITPHIDRPPLSITESRKLDNLLTKKISQTS